MFHIIFSGGHPTQIEAREKIKIGLLYAYIVYVIQDKSPSDSKSNKYHESTII